MNYRLYNFTGGFILQLSYSDGTEYYSTEDMHSIRNFFQVTGSIERSGNVTDEQSSAWYQLDKSEGLTG